jgi:predicted permease
MRLALKSALRQLARSPAFAAVSILILALGIGLSTAAFCVTNGILLRPLPFPTSDRLIRVFSTSPQSDALALSPGDSADVRSGMSELAALAAYVPMEATMMEPGQSPELQSGLQVSADFLRVLALQPMLGRDFRSDEDRPGKPGVVLLTHSYWQRRFGSDRAILGKHLRIGTSDVTVVGVLPPSFDRPLLWRGCGWVRNLTVWPNWTAQRKDKWVSVIGRLHPATTLQSAQRALSTIATRLEHDHPVDNAHNGLRATPLGASHVDSGTRPVYWLLTGLALLVLVIAAANLASVQLARAFGREHEFAVRFTLGANRRALLLPLLAEALILAATGLALGLLLAHWAGQLISRHWGGIELPMDGRVLGFAGVAALLSAATFGLAPAWLLARSVTCTAMTGHSRGYTAGRSQRRLKHLLVIGQLGLAPVLVSVALSIPLGVRAFLNRDRGWQPQGLVAGDLNVPYELHAADLKSPQLTRKVLTELAAIPGVDRASIASGAPVYGYPNHAKIIVQGREPLVTGQEPEAFVIGADRGYFGTMGIPLRYGVLLPERYRPGDPHVIVVNAALAERYWPGQSALGQRLRFTNRPDWYEVVGVVGDVDVEVGFYAPLTRLQVYPPIDDSLGIQYNFVLQTRVPAATVLPSIRQAIGRIHPDLVVSRVGDVPSRMAAMVADTKFLTGSIGVFALTGVLIAIVGLYGVINQLTQQRRREMGIRMALGADYRRLLRLILGQAAALLAIGSIFGLIGGLWVRGTLQNSMPEAPLPGVALQALVALSLSLAGLAACFGPARRAARANPVDALRAE